MLRLTGSARAVGEVVAVIAVHALAKNAAAAVRHIAGRVHRRGEHRCDQCGRHEETSKGSHAVVAVQRSAVVRRRGRYQLEMKNGFLEMQ